jgi:periplasmic divalent cation tolerance protein
MAFSILYVTHPSKEVAEKISQHLLQQHLVAGANLFPIESAYWWQGNIQQEGEWVTIYQAPSQHWEQIQKEIRALHPYEVPCMIKLPAEANTDYEEWVAKTGS